MRAKEYKTYVDVETGAVYQKPVKLGDALYVPKPSLYEITFDQAKRILAGEPLAAVIRDGIEAKVTADLEAVMAKGRKPAEEAPVPEVARATEPAEPEAVAPPDLAAELEGLRSEKDVDAFAQRAGIAIPDEYDKFTTKKEYLKTVLAD